MPALRLCLSCAGPRPRAAVRCPWCMASYTAPRRTPEHLFASIEGEWKSGGRLPPGGCDQRPIALSGDMAMMPIAGSAGNDGSAGA